MLHPFTASLFRLMLIFNVAATNTAKPIFDKIFVFMNNKFKINIMLFFIMVCYKNSLRLQTY
ncbi:hypothetical protein FACS189426_05620 [Bacteroidia bacterium]|nr:hypothetical protein FACS189426_05620 [Bacteroidia bacterium]GHT85349.1 hypothetical protein FACS18947_4000 [Bacteroidia bacterium]